MTSIKPRENASQELPGPGREVLARELAKYAGNVDTREELIQSRFEEEKGLVLVLIGDADKEEIPQAQKD